MKNEIKLIDKCYFNDSIWNSTVDKVKANDQTVSHFTLRSILMPRKNYQFLRFLLINSNQIKL